MTDWKSGMDALKAKKAGTPAASSAAGLGVGSEKPAPKLGRLFMLWLTLGSVGAHRFAMGRRSSGAAMALLFVVSIVAAGMAFSDALGAAMEGKEVALGASGKIAEWTGYATLLWWIVDGVELAKLAWDKRGA
jgi:hypothetical protein